MWSLFNHANMLSELQIWHSRFCQHCQVMKGQSPYTIKGYRHALSSLVKITGASRLVDLSIATIERWISEGTCQLKWSPVTSRGRIKYMIVFAKWLVKQGQLESNPLEGIEMPRVPKKIPQSLSKREAEDLLRFTRNYRFSSEFEGARAYAIIAMFIFTGIRKRELRDLGLSDVDLDHRVLSIRQGKGAKDRIVAIPPQLLEPLTEYLSFRSEKRFEHLPYFFVGAKAQGRVSIKLLTRLVTKLREKSGIYFFPHMLRHTYATLMLEGGCDIFSLSKLLGHADIKTTTVYLSANIAHLQEQVLKHPVI